MASTVCFISTQTIFKVKTEKPKTEIPGVRMPVIGCDSQGNMVAETGYVYNVPEQQRYFTTARSKGKREVTIPLDRVSLTAYRTHGSISFAIINHTGR